MSTLHSNHSYFNPAEHTFFRNYEPCDFCCVTMDEEMVSKVDGYTLCEECKDEYLEGQKYNTDLDDNCIAIKYSGDVNETF